MTKFGSTTFAYNDAGVRIRKGTTEYYVEGSRILAEKRNGTMIYYFYDESGVAGFEYGGKKYYYQKNLQGDVLGIYDDCGNLLGSYLYDARGKILAQSTNNILSVNPFRYRGYYYDTETKLYYLNTRYYDPETGRFISPDSTDYLDPVAINGLNLYAYCGNNPVMYVDPEGTAFLSILIALGAGALIGGTVGAAFEFSIQLIASHGFDWGKIGLAFLGGAVAGAITAIPIPSFQALGGLGKFFSYSLSFLTGAAGTLAGGAIAGSIDFNSYESIILGILIGGFANVAARGISDFIINKHASKIYNLANKAKSLTVQKLQANKLNLGAGSLKGGMRNAFKGVTKSQIMTLLNNANIMYRYGIYASINGAFLSGIPYMFGL